VGRNRKKWARVGKSKVVEGTEGLSEYLIISSAISFASIHTGSDPITTHTMAKWKGSEI